MSEKQPILPQSTPIKQPLQVKNCFGNYTPTTTKDSLNPFADLSEETQILKMEEIFNPHYPQGPKFGGPNAPIWNQSLPPRTGPLLWWQKDDEDLNSKSIWHRRHRMSPEIGAPEVESLRHTVPPKPPSHGRSAQEYEEE